MCDPVSSPVQGEAVEPVADTEAVETVYAEPRPTSQHDHDGTCGRDCDAGWICTRTRGHDGNHEAGLGGGARGTVLAASWPNEHRPAAVPTQGEAVEAPESIVCMEYPDCDREHAGGAGGVPVHPPAGSRISGDEPLIPDDVPSSPAREDGETWVRFYFSDADPVAECECGWRTIGDAAVDAFRAWWKHRASHYPEAS